MFNLAKSKDSKTLFRSKNSKKRSKWGIALASFVSFITIGGSVTAIYFSTTNYNLSSQYGKSYDANFTTTSSEDSSQPLFEDPCMGGSDTNTNDAHYRTDIGSNTDTYVKNVESPYSSYLASLQINDFDISSKYDGTSHSIYTKTVLPNHKYIDPDDTDKNTKIDESPTKVYFNDVSSSRISLLYSKVGDAKDGHRFSSIIVPERYLDTTKKIRLSDDRKNVYVNIKQEIGDGINDCLATPTPPDSSSNNYGDDSKPLNQVYVLNDVNGLINRMWTDIQIYYYSKHHPTFDNHWSGTREDYDKWMKVLDDAYKNMKVDGDEKFASDYFSSSDPTFSKVKSFRTDINDTNGFQDFLDKNSTNANDDILRSICSQFYHWIDGTKDGQDWKYDGKVKYDFMKEYVVGIINNGNLSTYLPDKNPTQKDKDANHSWLVLGDNNLSVAQHTYSSYKKYQFSLPQENWALNFDPSTLKDNPTNVSEMGLFGKINSTLIQERTIPTFKNSWYKGSPLLSSIIALVAVIVLVGVLISVLYRIPWLMALGCVLATLSITILLMLFGGYAISLGFFAGILAVFICSSLTICLFMERMKKHIKGGATPLMSFKKTIKTTIFQGIDIHFVSLLIGVCFIFMGTLDLNVMGVFMTIGTLFSTLFILCLWPLMNWLIYYKDFRNIKLLMLTGKITPLKPNDTQLNVLQTTFVDTKLKFKLNVFNNILKIVVITVFSSIVVLGIILLASNPNQNIINALGNKAIGEYCLSGLYAWLISLGLVSVYGLIRLNWTTFIPLLVTLILSTLIPFMVMVVAQIPLSNINPEFIIGIALSYATTSMMMIVFSCNFNNGWIKTHLLSKKLLKEILNKEILNSSSFMLLIIGMTLGSTLILLVGSSTSLVWVYAISLIFTISGMFMIYSVLPWMLFIFICLRYKYIGGSKRKLDNSFEKTNYDDVDEQEISGINKFKKIRATV